MWSLQPPNSHWRGGISIGPVVSLSAPRRNPPRIGVSRVHWRRWNGRLGATRRPKFACGRTIDSLTDRSGAIQLLWALVDLLIDDKKWAEARSELERLGQEKVRTDLTRFLNARIQFGESKWIDAANELEAIYPSIQERSALAYQANLMLGHCYEQIGDLDARHAAFRRAVALVPSGVAARLGLAATLAAIGRIDEAITGYRRVIDEEPRVGPDTARLMILRNLQRSAVERDWSEVEEVLDKSSRTMPESAEIAILRTEALAAQGQSDRARELLERARNERPTEIKLWIA